MYMMNDRKLSPSSVDTEQREGAPKQSTARNDVFEQKDDKRDENQRREEQTTEDVANTGDTDYNIHRNEIV